VEAAVEGTIRRQQHRATAEEIKRVARRQMAEAGAAALSLRAIAAEMGITAPAIYRYFPNRDALVTALIVDAFDALGAATREAAVADPGAPAGERMLAGLRAYRAWALAHPAEFALLFGTPILGYHAPREVTVPAARRAFAALLEVPVRAWARGELVIPDDHETASGKGQQDFAPGVPLPRVIYERLIEGWGTFHGLLSLELTGHLGPAIADTSAAYERAIREVVRRVGLSLASREPP
jgi:AcrR family transcriptional regulator